MSDFVCPGCKEPLALGLDPCPGCGAPIAWSYCGACLAANPPGSTRCVQCGRSLHAGPASLPDRFPCPRCEGRMAERPVRGLPTRECASCRGTFVENTVLRQLEELEAPAPGQAPAPRVPRPPKTAGPVVYIRCPACAEVMNRVQFGRYSGIVVDVCRQHGTFFDADEIERARAFLQAGGLEAAKKRAAEEAAERAREEKAKGRRASRKTTTGAKLPVVVEPPPTTPEDAFWLVAHELGKWLRSR